MNASKYIVFILILFIGLNSFGQSSEKLKQKQSELLKKIENTKSLIGASQSSQKLTVDEIEVLQSRIELKQDLLANIKQQIVRLDNDIKANENSSDALSEKVVKLKEQFKKLVRAAYKYRNKYDNIIYIFSSEDFNEAYKRMKYVEKLKDYRVKQVLAIKNAKKELGIINEELEKKRQAQIDLLQAQKKFQSEIQADQKLKQLALKDLKSQESDLLAQLKKSQIEQAKLQSAIQSALKKELEEEMRRARVEKRRRDSLQAIKDKKNVIKPKPTDPAKPVVTKPIDKPKPTPKVDLTVTKEVALTGANFASNKGKLPWPVAKGTITKKYGKHAHPVHVGVYTQNNGIDIKTTKGANVRAIYKGKVTSVLVISGAGKVVIVAHGNYRTVYTNLQEVYVKKGQEISTKEKIGSLLPSKSGKTSTAHIEIHVIKDGSISKLNPALWITK